MIKMTEIETRISNLPHFLDEKINKNNDQVIIDHYLKIRTYEIWCRGIGIYPFSSCKDYFLEMFSGNEMDAHDRKEFLADSRKLDKTRLYLKEIINV
jgi:hypothetical protein